MDFVSAEGMSWLEDARRKLRDARAAGRMPHSLLLLSIPGLGAEAAGVISGNGPAVCFLRLRTDSRVIVSRKATPRPMSARLSELNDTEEPNASKTSMLTSLPALSQLMSVVRTPAWPLSSTSYQSVLSWFW